MRLYYRLYENDYLQHQLYLASTSKRIENKRKRSYFWIIAFFASIAVISFILTNNSTAILSITIAGITAIFYPIYERKHYEKHYKEYIKENYPDKPDEKSYIEFMVNEVVIHNDHSESKLDYITFDRFIEIENYIFIRIGATSLILPKERIENLDIVRDYLKTLATRLSKEYIENLTWKWK